jgi:hypothetical protein
MDESNTAVDKKQKRQNPPRSLGRIAGEILAGAAVGFVMAYGVALVTAIPFVKESCFGPVEAMAVFVLAFPVVYVLATAGSVYFVGRIGDQTGSFLATFGGVFLGVPVIVLLCLYIDMAGDMMLGTVKIVLWTLVFLAPATMATLCFNLTRKYKQSPFGHRNSM